MCILTPTQSQIPQYLQKFNTSTLGSGEAYHRFADKVPVYERLIFKIIRQFADKPKAVSQFVDWSPF